MVHPKSQVAPFPTFSRNFSRIIFSTRYRPSVSESGGPTEVKGPASDEEIWICTSPRCENRLLAVSASMLQSDGRWQARCQHSVSQVSSASHHPRSLRGRLQRQLLQLVVSSPVLSGMVPRNRTASRNIGRSSGAGQQ